MPPDWWVQECWKYSPSGISLPAKCWWPPRRNPSATSGVTLLPEGQYPVPKDCEGKDDVFVGRLRRDTSLPSALNLWCVSDNLRKGAATNAVQIAELLLRFCQK